MNSQSERTDEEVVGRLIKWCDLHGIVAGSSLYYAMKLLILAEINKALSAKSEGIKDLEKERDAFQTQAGARKREVFGLKTHLSVAFSALRLSISYAQGTESDKNYVIQKCNEALTAYRLAKEKQNANPKS